MAVNLSVAELVAALRLLGTAEETEQATRLLAYASERVLKHAPLTPRTLPIMRRLSVWPATCSICLSRRRELGMQTP